MSEKQVLHYPYPPTPAEIQALCDIREMLGGATVRGHTGLPCSVLISFPSHQLTEKFASLVLVFAPKSERATDGD